MRVRRRPLVGGDIVEQRCPAAVTAAARAVSVDYRPVASDRYLRGLAGDVQRSQHALVRVGYGPGETLLLAVLVQLLDALVWVCADDVEGDFIAVVRTDLVLEAP